MKHTHVVCLVGGLGNQMFGYAFYKYLQHYLHRPARPSYIFWFIEKTAIANGIMPTWVSDVFYTDTVYSDSFISTWMGQNYRKISYAYNRLICDTVYKENTIYTYDDNMDFDKKYFIGYFQSYKYADAVRPQLLQDFCLKPPLSGYAQDMQQHIQNTPNAVAIHIRRGNYVGGYDGYWHVLDVDYYRSAWEKIIAKYPDATPYIFSQDTDWCQQNLTFLPDPIFVSPNDDAQYEDMILMSLCTHNIIANSSYSWWGAYLNRHPDKMVVCPRYWNKALQGTQALQDFIPPDWSIV